MKNILVLAGKNTAFQLKKLEVLNVETRDCFSRSCLSTCTIESTRDTVKYTLQLKCFSTLLYAEQTCEFVFLFN